MSNFIRNVVNDILVPDKKEVVKENVTIHRKNYQQAQKEKRLAPILTPKKEKDDLLHAFHRSMVMGGYKKPEERENTLFTMKGLGTGWYIEKEGKKMQPFFSFSLSNNPMVLIYLDGYTTENLMKVDRLFSNLVAKNIHAFHYGKPYVLVTLKEALEEEELMRIQDYEHTSCSYAPTDELQTYLRISLKPNEEAYLLQGNPLAEIKKMYEKQLPIKVERIAEEIWVIGEKENLRSLSGKGG